LVNLLCVGVVLTLAACGTGASSADQRARQPRQGQAGLQLSGSVQGRQLVVRDGLPELEVGDCDPRAGPSDDDVCFISETIDGRLFVFVIENPDALTQSRTLPIEDPPCAGPQACDRVSDAAVVEVQLGTDDRIRADGGELTIDRLRPFSRYTGSVTAQLGDGQVSGSFEVVPRPDE
jgi:hypothetical protein